MSTFRKDLKYGQRYEKIAMEYFDSKNNTIYAPKGYHKQYDFIVNDEFKVEVKCDRMAFNTGNLAIEYRCNGIDSGINATTAHVYMYFIIKKNGYDCYKIPVEKLKKICLKHGRKIRGGDFKSS